MSRGKLVAFLGPVGVGKSTVIRALLNLSKKRGIKTKFACIKAFHGPSYLLWKIVSYIIARKARAIS